MREASGGLARGCRIALVVGGTAGETFPALAVAAEFRVRDPRAEMCFIGAGESVAVSLLGQAGESFSQVPGSPLRRTGPAGAVKAGIETLRSIAVSRRLLPQLGADLVIGFGGYASGGVLTAAKTLGLPTVVFEPNVEFQLANHWLTHVADVTIRGLGPTHVAAVGVPIRPEVAALTARPSEAPQGGLRLLVMSSSRGEELFAERLPGVVRRLVSEGIAVAVRQQAAKADALRARYASGGAEALVSPFIDDIASAYAWADVVVARCGASTIAELAAAGKPAFLVPLADAAANHQAANAALWSRAGGGPISTEREWNDDAVFEWMKTMATDRRAWLQASACARSLARPGAAVQAVELCERLLDRVRR